MNPLSRLTTAAAPVTDDLDTLAGSLLDPAAATPLDGVLDGVVLILILLGAVLCLTAAIGLLRFRDVPTRLHAATKPQVLGLILICLAIALSLRSWPVVAFLVPVVLIQLATAPLSAHMVGRQAYRNGTIDETGLYVDELAESKRTPPAAGG